jgi:hypothetical protein
MTFLSFSHLPETTGPMSPRKEAENEKGGMKKGMKKLAVLALLFMLVIPVLPIALADDTTNVYVGIGADTVNLNVTCTTSTGGTMHIYVNGTEVMKFEHNYPAGGSRTSIDNDVIYLSQKIGGVEFNLIALANYAEGKLSMLLVNDNCLAKWVGCLNTTTIIGQRIFDGNSTIVMELDRLTNDDIELLDMIENLGNAVEHLDSQIGEVQFNQITLANYTDEKLSMLLINDNYLVKWIGCLNTTTLIGRRISDGNSTVVMELTRLTGNDDVLLNMVIKLGNTVRQIDDSHKAKLVDLEALLKSQAERLSTLETELAPEFNVTNLKIEPKEVEPGKEVTISVKVTNTGELPGTYKVTSVKVANTGELPRTYKMALGVKDGIEIILEKEVTLEGGKSETLEFKISPEVEGTYDVEVDGLKGSFTVKVPGISSGYIAGILIIISAAIASVYALYRRGRLPLHNLPKSTP